MLTKRAGMLGYSRRMHKHAFPRLLWLLLAMTGTALAQTTPASPLRPAVRIPPPDPALRAAFAATDQGRLDDLALAGFQGQPLAGWLEYAALRSQLDTLPLTRGRAFLTTHAGEPVAEAFRSDWLAALARRNEWQAFLDAWDSRIESPALRCLRLQALMMLDRVDADWDRQAQALWRSSGASLPAQCDAPFALLAARGGLDDALRWERFDKALDAAQTGVMRRIAQGLPPDQAALALAYADYLDAPGGDIRQWPKTARSQRVAVLALSRLAKTDPDRAERLLPDVAQVLGLDATAQGKVRQQIALWSLVSYLPDAERRLAAVPASAEDDLLREWRLRQALARADWPAARAALERLSPAQRSDSRWLYLAARVHELTGDADGARVLYAQAATRPEFHGFLAADRLGLPYALCPRPLEGSVGAKQALARDPGLLRALQLYQLNRRSWALREWNALLARLDAPQRRLAVELAQDNGWYDRGVFGLVNVGNQRYPDEQALYVLRFPLAYTDIVQREAARNGLDPAWVIAEIRAESVFDPQARSSADARGLMQLLPDTGRTLAAQLGLPWSGPDALLDPVTNITLGSVYLRQLLDRYGSQPAYAIAAYNAGPAAVERWRAQRPALDADFWIETIPYRETRDYVARVLAFSVLYDWRLQGTALRVSDRLRGRFDAPRTGFVCPAANPTPSPQPSRP